MVEIKIPAEIQAYKSKFIFGLSIRQFVAVAGAIIVGGGIGMLGKGRISEDILTWLIIISVIPFAGYGFLKIHDMKFEEFVKQWILFNFFPQKRVYENADIEPIAQISEDIVALKIREERIEKGEIYIDTDEDEEEER